MIILGISISHDGTLCIIKDGNVIFSIGEERLIRKKCYIGFPFKSLRYVLKNSIIKAADIDSVVIGSHASFKKENAWIYAFVLTEKKKYYDIVSDKKPDDFFMDDNGWKAVKTDQECREYVLKKIKYVLEENGIKSPISFVDHHLSHTSSAYYSSGLNNVLSVSMDAEGDLISSTVCVCRNGLIEKIHEEPVSSSLGYLYSFTTKMCGFTIMKHEGKITGLAAYGDIEKTRKYFEERVRVENGVISFVDKAFFSKEYVFHIIKKIINKLFFNKSAPLYETIIKIIKNYSKEDLAAGAQFILEKRIREYIDYYAKKTGLRDIVLSGGVFANVKVNQIISELDSVDSVYIHPNMGDGGTAYGGAMYEYIKKHKGKYNAKEFMFENIFFGPSYSNNEIERSLEKNKAKISYEKYEYIELEAAKLIAKNNIIAWFQGGMEYGPRALGNRSILASPVDSTINKWLNNRLKRTEFMPFAPSCLDSFANDVFEIPKKSLIRPAEYMTITFKVKDEWVNKIPAVVHVDQTARPQIVREQSNKKYYNLLNEYYKLTKLPLVINTSFNVHEEPIVCSPDDAIKPLLLGVIDYLVIGNFVCYKKKNA